MGTHSKGRRTDFSEQYGVSSVQGPVSRVKSVVLAPGSEGNNNSPDSSDSGSEDSDSDIDNLQISDFTDDEKEAHLASLNHPVKTRFKDPRL